MGSAGEPAALGTTAEHPFAKVDSNGRREVEMDSPPPLITL